MKLSILHPDIWYFENAIPEAEKFLSLLEDNKNITSVIPDWSEWRDTYARGADEVIIDKPLSAGEGGAPMGVDKFVDWDMSINDYGRIWPRIVPDSETHNKAYQILKLIDLPFKKVLDYYWSQNPDFPKLQYISKNYPIRKYSPGTAMPVHVDATGLAGTTEDDKISMDLAALIYLNDKYTGGELNFVNLGIRFKPSAGSIVIFDGIKHQHESTLIESGNKIYIPFYIHTKFGWISCFREPVEAGGSQNLYLNKAPRLTD
jgi:hypothetical protein